MTDEELSTMLETVADEFDSRSIAGATGLRTQAFELRPKRVYIWVGDRPSGFIDHWCWNDSSAMWDYHEDYTVYRGNIFADHEPDEAATMATMNPKCVDSLPPNWNCRK